MNEEKKYDDTNWKEEILSSIEFNQSKFASKLLKDGAKSYMQSIYLGYLYTRWKKLKGYDKYQIQEILEKRNEGQGYGTIARSMGMNRGTVQKIINRENALVGIQ